VHGLQTNQEKFRSCATRPARLQSFFKFASFHTEQFFEAQPHSALQQMDWIAEASGLAVYRFAENRRFLPEKAV